MSDQTPLDVEAIRAALADLDTVVDGVSGVKGRYGWKLSGVSQHVNMHADLKALLGENASLNAENNMLKVQLHNSKMCALRELEAQIRGDEAEAHRDALAAKLNAVRELHEALEVDWTGGRRCRICRGPNGSAVMWPCATIAALDAAPEMPRPPAEEGEPYTAVLTHCEECARPARGSRILTAQPPASSPEKPGTGSGRGTGVAETSGTAQAGEGWYEFIHPIRATTEIAHVSESGRIYLPEAQHGLTEEDFRLAAASNRFWRLVREGAPSLPVPSTEEQT